MKKKNIFFTLCSIVFICILDFQLYAQQLPWFSQYREYQGIINPSFLSSDFIASEGFYNSSMGLSYAQAGFANISEVPVTQTLRAEWIPKSLLKQNFGLLLGGFILNDQFGPTGFTGAFARIAIFASGVPKTGGLSIGFNVGAIQYRLKASETSLLVKGDPLGEINQAQILPNIGFGISYNKRISGRHDFYAGFSMPQLFNLDLTETEVERGQEDFKKTLSNQYYVMLGAYIYQTDFSFWEPSLWLKYLPDKTFHVDFNLRYQFRTPFWIGVGASNHKTLHVEVGVLVGNTIRKDNQLSKSRKRYLKIGLGYDSSFTALPSERDQYFEINLTMVLPQKSKPT